VICDRCGKGIESEHPNRISIYKHRVEEYKDYFGKPHKKSVYKAENPRHLCSECEIKFNEFWENSK
jgi:hypothetical protein